jgi:CBS domain-containing protein
MKIDAILATKGMNVITIHPDQTVKHAVTLLSKNNIGALVVVDNTTVVGILSERDIVRRLAQDEHVVNLNVRDLMTAKVVTGTPNDDLDAVMRTMTDRHFRHLPIVEHGKLEGIVALGDIVKARLDQYKGEIENLHSQIS